MTENTIKPLPHHQQQELCKTRPPYRQGKKLTAVKVYTINDESQHLMICGVPKLKLREEIKRLVFPYGEVKKVHVVADYPTEEFTEAFHVLYARIQSARIAKRFLDGKNFFGGILHVFYVPELETITETRNKLLQRRKDVLTRIKRNAQDPTNVETDPFVPKEQYHRRKKTPALPLTQERLTETYPNATLTSIYDGIPKEIDPRPITEPSLPPQGFEGKESKEPLPEFPQTPYQPSELILQTAESQETERNRLKWPFNPGNRKRKNYKGQIISEAVKVRVVRPQLIDTRRVAKTEGTVNIFSNVKKVDSGINIKLVAKDDSKKRIVINNPSTKSLIKSSEDLRSSIDLAKLTIRQSMEENKLNRNKNNT